MEIARSHGLLERLNDSNTDTIMSIVMMLVIEQQKSFKNTAAESFLRKLPTGY